MVIRNSRPVHGIDFRTRLEVASCGVSHRSGQVPARCGGEARVGVLTWAGVRVPSLLG